MRCSLCFARQGLFHMKTVPTLSSKDCPSNFNSIFNLMKNLYYFLFA